MSERESPVAPDEVSAPSRPETRDRGALIAELLLAAVVCLLGLVILIETREIRVMRTYANVGPRVLPTIVGYGLMVIGIWLAADVVRGGGARPSTEAEDADVTRPTDWSAITLISLALVAYLLLLERAGYVIASTVLFSVAAFGMGSRRLVRDLTSAIGLSLLTWFIFTEGLSLRLPAGWLDGIL